MTAKKVAIRIKLTAAERVNAITLDQVAQSYSGAARRCCCGCSGTHHYASSSAERAKRECGKVNDRAVKMALNFVKKNAHLAEWNSDTCVSVETETRIRILYLAAANRAEIN